MVVERRISLFKLAIYLSAKFIGVFFTAMILYLLFYDSIAQYVSGLNYAFTQKEVLLSRNKVTNYAAASELKFANVNILSNHR